VTMVIETEVGMDGKAFYIPKTLIGPIKLH
jgi:hypothetical protein